MRRNPSCSAFVLVNLGTTALDFVADRHRAYESFVHPDNTSSYVQDHERRTTVGFLKGGHVGEDHGE